MTEVLVGTGAGHTEAVVTEVADAVAVVAHSQVRRVELDAALAGEQGAAVLLLHEMDKPTTLLGVLARDEPTPSTWQQVVRDATKPVVVVPEMAELSRPMISRVLVPLDGTPEAAGAVARTVALFAGAGVDVVVLHVFDASTVPRFWDQAAHARRAWEEEFMTRFCAQPGARLELRSGTAGQQVVDVAATEGVDLITLGWSQRLDPGRAQTVRRTVLEAAVPVMLVPLTAT
jgi:nucleotide-binding universal stress UspA family protein